MSLKADDFNADPLKFASLMAHQIQSPLNAVSSSLQNVLAEYAGPLLPQQRASLEKATARCDQAITSVRRILAIIKAESGRDTSAPPASLNAVARQVHAQYVAETGKHTITLTIDTMPGSPYVHLPEAALSEILSALLNNAIKFTPDHGRIRVTTRPGKTPDFVRLSVADSGVGVPEKNRKRVFDPFFSTPATRASSRPGVGLGLAFVKSIVVGAGGTVRLGQSDLGGAALDLEIPVAPAPEAAEEPGNGRPPAMRVVVIGGVTAGPKAAAKIIRLMPETDVTIIEKGSVLSYAGCGLPYYVSGVVRDPKRLISSPAGVVRDPIFFRQVMNVHVMNQTEALEIDRTGKRVKIRDSASGHESFLFYDKLLLATGASPIVPKELDVRLSNVFTLHGVKDAEGIKTALAEGHARDVVIVGGGLIGIEMTEALVRKGARVTIVEKLPHILPILDPDISCLVMKHLEQHGVRVMTNTRVLSLQGEGRVTGVATEGGALAADMVILACGIRPNVKLAAEAGLTLGTTGALLVDSAMRTSDPDIYAAGDCVETVNRVTGKPCYVPLGSTASKQGRVAAINICGGQDVFSGVMGSCICKVFDYTVARTGMGEADARAMGYDVMTVLVPGLDRAHYMPTAGLILLKMTVDRKNRRLLGAQATGPGAADKRIDVAATAIAAGLTVDEMAGMDLCYAPQYSTDMDNLITAANVARNKLDGILVSISAAEVHRMMKEHEDFIFLDVRTPEEHDRLRLPNAMHIPLGSLRGRIGELPKDKEIVAFSEISLRGYEASLILRAAGFTRLTVLEGGIAMWPYDILE